MHPLPAAAEDEFGVKVQIREDSANTAAGSGLHDADCSAYGFVCLSCIPIDANQ